ncbi:hypothetical protein, partial [Frankia sp. CpI1-P]|uniref:hypothetical protein n=1 Tax=Frankia sp. CpI1-P TaxID=1502734 RepID=UPI0018FE1803
MSDLVARAIRDPAAWRRTPFFDRVPEIVALATDLDVVTVTTGDAGEVGTYHFHPSSAGAPRASVYVHYNGVDHYQAMVTVPGAAPASAGHPLPRGAGGPFGAGGPSEEEDLLRWVRGRLPVDSVYRERPDEILAVYRRLRSQPQNRRRLTRTLAPDVAAVLHGGPVGRLLGAGPTDSPGEPADPWRAIQLELDPPDGLRVFGPAD